MYKLVALPRKKTIKPLLPILEKQIDTIRFHPLFSQKQLAFTSFRDTSDLFKFVHQAEGYVQSLIDISSPSHPQWERVCKMVHEFGCTTASPMEFRMFIREQINFSDNGSVNFAKNLDTLFHAAVLGHLAGIPGYDVAHVCKLIYSFLTPYIVKDCAEKSEPDSAQKLFWTTYFDTVFTYSGTRIKKPASSTLELYDNALEGTARFALVLPYDIEKRASFYVKGDVDIEFGPFTLQRDTIDDLGFKTRTLSSFKSEKQIEKQIYIRSVYCEQFKSSVFQLSPFLGKPGFISLAILVSQNIWPGAVVVPGIRSTATLDEPHGYNGKIDPLSAMDHDLGHLHEYRHETSNRKLPSFLTNIVQRRIEWAKSVEAFFKQPLFGDPVWKQPAMYTDTWKQNLFAEFNVLFSAAFFETSRFDFFHNQGSVSIGILARRKMGPEDLYRAYMKAFLVRTVLKAVAVFNNDSLKASVSNEVIGPLFQCFHLDKADAPVFSKASFMRRYLLSNQSVSSSDESDSDSVVSLDIEVADS